MASSSLFEPDIILNVYAKSKAGGDVTQLTEFKAKWERDVRTVAFLQIIAMWTDLSLSHRSTIK